jgi:N-acyl-D-aspartate/D-glutamate deacylase
LGVDLLLKNGTVVDGSGAAPRRADVAVANGRIVSVGEPVAAAARVADVSDLVVAPGFIDIHTHFDAQILWDPDVSPSTLHGVTTVIGGNCGFSLAPVRTVDVGYLQTMMARVEGLPLAALEAALQWDWSSFGDYLDRLEGRIVPNAGFLLGHSALRRAVMGAAAVGEVATAAQRGEMERLLHESLAAGALGFSTSRAITHWDADGNPVPSRFADREEVLRLAEVVGQHPGAALATIMRRGANGYHPLEDRELMVSMSVVAGRPINWNAIGRVDTSTRGWIEESLGSTGDARKVGGQAVGVFVPIPQRTRLTLAVGSTLSYIPGWVDFFSVPVGERAEALRDPEARRRLQLASDATLRDDKPTQKLPWETMTVMEVFSPQNEPFIGRTVGEVGSGRGTDPFNTAMDIALADDLRTSFELPAPDDSDSSWAERAKLLTDDRTVAGGSDAGAHLDLFCNSIIYTGLLRHAVRQRGLVPLEEAIRQLTEVPARLYGIRGRGKIQEGYWADIVVFDDAGIGYTPWRTVQDLPGGASRLFSAGTGIESVLVNGTEVVRNGASTGAQPGTVLRSGRDTDSVDTKVRP